MRNPLVRDGGRRAAPTIGGRPHLTTWNDLLGPFPGLIGVKTGHTSEAGWSQVAAARGPGVTIYATHPRQPDARRAATPTSPRCSPGGSPGTAVVRARRRQARLRDRVRPATAAARSSSSRPARSAGPSGRPSARRARRRARRGRRSPSAKGERLGEVRGLGAAGSSSAAGRSSRPDGHAAPGCGGGSAGTRAGPRTTRWGSDHVIVTVTHERGDRPHADRAELPARPPPPRQPGAHARRRQGHQRRACAEAARRARSWRPGSPAAAPARGSSRSSPREAILNDFVRIAEESRTSTAVVDPTGGTYTEINEWGPHVRARGARDAAREAALPLAGAEVVVFAGSLPRGVDDGFYGEAIRDLNRRGVHTVLDSDGEPLRARASRPSRSSSRRTSARPRRSSGRSSTTRTTSSIGLERDRRAWARATC